MGYCSKVKRFGFSGYLLYTIFFGKMPIIRKIILSGAAGARYFI